MSGGWWGGRKNYDDESLEVDPGGKPCSRGTHNETVKRLPLFFAVINGIVIESHSIAQSCGGIFNSSIKSKIYIPGESIKTRGV